jgi:hypothetical protein
MFNNFANMANAVLDQPQNAGKATKFTLSPGAKQAPAVHHGWWYKFDLGEYDTQGPTKAFNDWQRVAASYGISNNPAGSGPSVSTGGASVAPGSGEVVQTGGTTTPREETGRPSARISPLLIGGIAAAALLGFILLRKK